MESITDADVLPLDIQIVVLFQSLFGENYWGAWNFITELGTATTSMVVIGFMLWRGHRSAAIAILIAILTTGLLVSLIKIFSALPRPYYAYEAVAAWRDSSGFGMPSGHAAGAMTLWLLLALYVRRLWFYVISTVLILLIGVSRIYFGVHSGSQVLLGWLLGLSVSLLILSQRTLAMRLFTKANAAIFIIAALTSILLLIGLQKYYIQPKAEKFIIPTEWSERFNRAVAYEDALDEEEFSPKQLKLFDAVGLNDAGIIAGVLVLLAWLRKQNSSIPDQIRRGWQLTFTTAIGLFCVALLAVLIEITEDYAIPNFFVWLAVPITLAVSVPAAARVFLDKLGTE